MINKWVSILKESSAIRKFILLKKLNIQLELEERVHTINIEYGDIILTNTVNNDPDVILKISDSTFEKLILGQVSIRNGISDNLVLIKSSFRNILLLDSIFQIASLTYSLDHNKNFLTIKKLV